MDIQVPKPILLLALLSMVYVCLAGVSMQDLKKFNKNLNAAADKAKKAIDEVDIKNRQKEIEGVDNKDKNTDNLLTLFAAPDEDVGKLARQASIQLKALKELKSTDGIDPYRLRVSKNYLKIWKKKFSKYCPTNYKGPSCNACDYYRTADGSCNNLYNPTWGATFSPETREIPPMYDDGVEAPREKDRLGGPLPSARVVSNNVHKVEGKSPRNENLTMMVMQWGQFIDHEFVATPVMKGAMGASIECCGNENENRSECFPIKIPENDPYFNKTCMSFVRSAPVPSLDCNPGFREQVNQVTSFIDGSAVYGSKVGDTMLLRKMKGGLLKTMDDYNLEDLLPQNTPDKCVLDTSQDYCQRAGDFRVNVVPSLGWSHTTFLREHNRIAKELASINPHWGDETLFQETRRIIAAIEQVITYKEYLPAILNRDTMRKYRLELKQNGYRRSYNKRINPTISNVFAVAAFRFGHSQIANYQGAMDKNYQYVEKKPIEHTYHRPHMIIHDHGMRLSGVARWLIDDPAPLADGLFEDGTRDKLFQDHLMNSVDLPALNIQRGRDHGIPSYNHWRIHCGLEKANVTNSGMFILPDHEQDQIVKLQQTYRHVDDIDLFPGAMTETLLPDSSVGPTFACLIGSQFKRLMKGDRFWHETSINNIRFTKGQLKEIRKISLAKVMCECYKFNVLQPNVFKVPGPDGRVTCDELPGMDLTKWTACKKPLSDGRPRFSKNCGRRRGNKRVD